VQICIIRKASTDDAHRNGHGGDPRPYRRADVECGDRLPSIRRLAGAMGVSPATVVEAYDRLVAEG
jgi:DNA-binding MarR family transcriptional regulator